jgi:DNA-binding NtrC family response regulator
VGTMTASSDHGGPVEAGVLAGLRVLVVEDSWHVAKAMTRLLRTLGADVAEPVATPAAARRLVSERRPDVALVDFSLRDGELAEDLIDWLQAQGICVIVITGYEVIPLAPGKAAAVLQKPVNATQLVATVRQVTSH